MKNVVVILLVALVILGSAAPVFAAHDKAYKPSHWSGRVKLYNYGGTRAGWSWGGGFLGSCHYSPVGKLCEQYTAYRGATGKYVRIGGKYGDVRQK